MLTGNTDADLGRRTLELGAFDYVAKPFDLARLTQVLEAASAFGGVRSHDSPRGDGGGGRN